MASFLHHKSKSLQTNVRMYNMHKTPFTYVDDSKQITLKASCFWTFHPTLKNSKMTIKKPLRVVSRPKIGC